MKKRLARRIVENTDQGKMVCQEVMTEGVVPHGVKRDFHIRTEVRSHSLDEAVLC
ncbi:hypothetical protein KDA_75680 [Dictyobacter alpinus]|uniref:Uncharacterized protein n=1 Tax=Dictyobacter alpinus TaxID=2014873 RepID=A0A402BL61_9CHLR|nr:hypothetical protein KDA_75680 [Dictyobacter alpinus]